LHSFKFQGPKFCQFVGPIRLYHDKTIKKFASFPLTPLVIVLHNRHSMWLTVPTNPENVMEVLGLVFPILGFYVSSLLLSVLFFKQLKWMTLCSGNRRYWKTHQNLHILRQILFYNTLTNLHTHAVPVTKGCFQLNAHIMCLALQAPLVYRLRVSTISADYCQQHLCYLSYALGVIIALIQSSGVWRWNTMALAGLRCF